MLSIPQASDIAAKAAERAFGNRLVTNVMRGLVAEAIVAAALESEWDWCSQDYNAWDLQHRTAGVRLEVKQSARLQTWASDRVRLPGASSFDIALREGRMDGAEWISSKRRWADLYVFAHHDIADDSANHCDPSQWAFYVVPTSALSSAASISLGPLRRLAPPRSFPQLLSAVTQALNQLTVPISRA